MPKAKTIRFFVLVIANQNDGMKRSETNFGRLSTTLWCHPLATQRFVQANVQVVNEYLSTVGHASERRCTKWRERAVFDTRAQVNDHESFPTQLHFCLRKILAKT